MRSSARSRWAKAAAVGLTTAAAGLLGPVQPAAAGSSCTIVCSETVNQSSYSATAVRDWTCSSGSTGTASTGCVSLTYTKSLAPWTQTPAGQDWDAFRVDAGWCYKVQFTDLVHSWTTSYNRSGLSAVYVKVSNDATAYIKAQKYGSCP
ncbi:hypothetical protein [Streptomyces sp. NPDC001380]|uniref:hypothetical protein n=1 Tax=Streptomyces sp. NPDC001380 TaxID=3364566 RepID=UPI0036C36A4B